MFGRLQSPVGVLALIPFTLLACFPAARAQTPGPDPVPDQDGPISTIKYQPPKILKLQPVACEMDTPQSRAPRLTSKTPECQAQDELRRGGEGWVSLSMMVDTHGKPFEIAVSDSTGNPLFEKAALSYAESIGFQPATEGGQPIESVFHFKQIYVNPGATGANKEFVRGYGIFETAITAQNRSAADQALGTLKVTNLYEDAYMGVAAYQYAKLWGTDPEQRAGLARAIANYDRGHYLPDDLHQSILFAYFNLEVKDHLYADALLTSGRLQKLKLNDKTAQTLAGMVVQIKKVQTDGSSYDVQGQILDEGYDGWHTLLYKHHFRISVQQGTLSVVKLRCEKKFVSFDFHPELQYDYSSRAGACTMEVIGAPGSRFTLTQFGSD